MSWELVRGYKPLAGFYFINTTRLQDIWCSDPAFHTDLVPSKCSVVKTCYVSQVSSLSLQTHVITNSVIGCLFLSRIDKYGGRKTMVGDSYHTLDKFLPFYHFRQSNPHNIHSSVAIVVMATYNVLPENAQIFNNL